MMSGDSRPIPGFPGYLALADGRILGLRGRPMSPKLDRDGYPSLTLRRPGGKTCKCVHQLVALAWLGERPSPVHHAAHSDGDKLNSAVSNLRWATPAENSADMVRHGHSTAGVRHPRAKLSDDLVREIRRMRDSGLQYNQIAAAMNISTTAAFKVAAGYRWKHVG